MNEVEIRLEREGRDGIVAVGTYLVDAVKRLGVRFEGECVLAAGEHFCSVGITSGADLLSPLTKYESDYFSVNKGSKNARLACQAKIEQPGEVAVMTKEKTASSEPEETKEDFKKKFAELPLEKKIAQLVQLEAIAFGDTVSFVINSPLKVFEKAMDVMAEFGLKLEREKKAATRPDEHKANGSETRDTGKAGRKKGHSGKTTPSSSADDKA